MKTYSPEILAEAECRLSPVAKELAAMAAADAEKVRESMALALESADEMEISQVIPRWRASVKARAEQSAARAAATESARIEMLKKELLASPVLVEFLAVLSRELMHPDTSIATVKDATASLSRLFTVLRP